MKIIRDKFGEEEYRTVPRGTEVEVYLGTSSEVHKLPVEDIIEFNVNLYYDDTILKIHEQCVTPIHVEWAQGSVPRNYCQADALMFEKLTSEEHDIIYEGRACPYDNFCISTVGLDAWCMAIKKNYIRFEYSRTIEAALADESINSPLVWLNQETGLYERVAMVKHTCKLCLTQVSTDSKLEQHMYSGKCNAARDRLLAIRSGYVQAPGDMTVADIRKLGAKVKYVPTDVKLYYPKEIHDMVMAYRKYISSNVGPDITLETWVKSVSQTDDKTTSNTAQGKQRRKKIKDN